MDFRCAAFNSLTQSFGAAGIVKDVVGPKGSVSIVSSIDESSDIASHSLAEALRVHPNGLGVEDTIISIKDTPDHDGLCVRQVCIDQLASSVSAVHFGRLPVVTRTR